MGKSGILHLMKPLSLAKPHLIVMVGAPGAGKSFFATHFSRIFSTPMVSWHNIRDELFNRPDYTKHEDAIVERVADHLLAELFKTGATILYESSVQSQVDRQAIAQAAKAAGYETLFVWVQVDTATAKARAVKNGLSLAQYERYEKTFTPPKESDSPVVISGKHTYASQLKIVLVRLSQSRARHEATTRSRSTGHSISIR